MSQKDKVMPYGEMITTGAPNSVLSGLYRTVLNELGIEESRFTTLVHKYVTRTAARSKRRDISSIRGNFEDAFLNNSMTWKVFVKGLQVINIAECNIAIQVWFNNPEQPSVSVFQKVQLSDIKNREANFDTALTALFNELMLAMGMTPKKFNDLLGLYIHRSHVPNNNQDVSNARGYLKKELLGDRISWKVFMNALVFLDVCQFTFAVQLHHRNRTITDHRRSISLDQEAIDTNE